MAWRALKAHAEEPSHEAMDVTPVRSSGQRRRCCSRPIRTVCGTGKRWKLQAALRARCRRRRKAGDQDGGCVALHHSSFILRIVAQSAGTRERCRRGRAGRVTAAWCLALEQAIRRVGWQASRQVGNEIEQGKTVYYLSL